MMQNLVLAVQNSVDVSNIGAASATVAFFRTLGGAIGVSVLGVILANSVRDNIVAGLTALGPKAAAAAAQAHGGTGTLDLKHMPAPIAGIVRASYGDATGHIFLVSAVFAVVALLAVLFVKEVPLRTTVSVTEAADSPVDPVPAPTSAPVRRSPLRRAVPDSPGAG
jgi:hypothetical protein